MRLFKFLGQLAELGIVMAPELHVPFKADHVTLEMRPKQGVKKVEFASFATPPHVPCALGSCYCTTEVMSSKTASSDVVTIRQGSTSEIPCVDNEWKACVFRLLLDTQLGCS
ncbi:hypothetical protein [Hydrogenophaga sp. RAC07]|uniref:hypothetical protein n=1 Tax=Hydrogenophaga sp. RAC07 TaxID=1842537 RepID=UPI0012EA3738|nr:hypothetical protein [Hydrogenophaga sp. RAC07]